MDANGTYYRAPPGGVSVLGANGLPFPGGGVTRDGGFYVPNDPAAAVSLYSYYSTTAAPTQSELLEADCSTLGVIKDPYSESVSIAAFAVGGEVAGVTSAIAGRSHAQSADCQAIGTT